MSLFELREWVESAIPWWFPFAVGVGTFLLCIWLAREDDKDL